MHALVLPASTSPLDDGDLTPIVSLDALRASRSRDQPELARGPSRARPDEDEDQDQDEERRGGELDSAVPDEMHGEEVVSDRPRERLLRSGLAAMSDEDLLALILGTGVRAHTARQIAQAIVAEVGGIAAVARASPRELAQVTGVGIARGARIAAGFELGRRASEARNHRRTVGRPEHVFELVAPRLAGLTQEVFLVIGVDIRNQLLEVVEVGRGSVNGVEVHPREVFRPLVRMAAAGGVLVHNHPSGDPSPSPEDRELTLRLHAVGQLVGIPIIDHVVIGAHAHCSLAEELGIGFGAPR